MKESTLKKRPPEPGKPVMVRLQPDMLAAIDDWRRKQTDMPSRAHALRLLADLAIKAKLK